MALGAAVGEGGPSPSWGVGDGARGGAVAAPKRLLGLEGGTWRGVGGGA